MTLVVPPTESTPAVVPRAIRLAGLAVPGALLLLSSMAAVSITNSHIEIARAVQALLTLH